MSFDLAWGGEKVRSRTHTEAPELFGRFDEMFPSVWPEYNSHGDVLGPRWGELYQSFPDFQLVLTTEPTGELLARGNTVPLAWDGRTDHLPSGIDELATSRLTGKADEITPTTLSAMAAEVPPRHRSKGLGTLLLKAMSALAAAHGFTGLLAPVRPSLKERYPLAPIEEYMHWTRPDGEPFDPWIRTHTMLGARVLRAAPHSLRITGTVAEWEEWTGMAFPASGRYVIPHGLAPLEIDRDQDTGRYWEPNVWMLHPVPAGDA